MLTLRRQVNNPAPTVMTTNNVDCSLNVSFIRSLGGSASITFTNNLDGFTIIVRIINTSGSTINITWPANVFGASTTVSGSSTRVYTFIRSGSNTYASSMEF